MSPLHGVRSTWRDVAWRGVGACAVKAGVCSRGWWATWRRWPRGSRRAAPRRSSVSSWIGRPLCPVNDSTRQYEIVMKAFEFYFICFRKHLNLQNSIGIFDQKVSLMSDSSSFLPQDVHSIEHRPPPMITESAKEC